MGLSGGAYFMIKHTPLPNGNHPFSIPICPMGVADIARSIEIVPRGGPPFLVDLGLYVDEF